MSDSAVALELDHRHGLLRELISEHGNGERVPTSTVNSLRIFYGGRGIWYDAVRTRSLAIPGVTMGVLHTGRHYEDDIDLDGIIYHYPRTGTPGKDAAEIEATKNTKRLGLPLFVVVQKGQFRSVRLAWVIDWDDANGEFLMLFGEDPITDVSLHTSPKDESDFEPFAPISKRRERTVKQRPNQTAFAFAVRKRYGAECAACDIKVPALIDAAHIIPDAESGSSDARNGLPLCATHHRAFDAGLIRVVPETLSWNADVEPGYSLADLGVTKGNILHLEAQPHSMAVHWRWENLHGGSPSKRIEMADDLA
jgi:hypothetical protein